MKAMETRFDLVGFLISRSELIQTLEVIGINKESLEAYIDRCVLARPSRYTTVYLFKQEPPHLMYPRVVLV